ncbi:hypothetical protein [Mesorhizobium sp.]|uniref:hypothetical protein n=1 Tax=Mesorhizobium sp. TaxID=1871066 RepID=UPI001202D199|nr:hypothetical protein [Mesorhizobium sp.]TIM06654.1 MAG: hypothetical protein E5Y62_23155 [Mesorhizobium sp.]
MSGLELISFLGTGLSAVGTVAGGVAAKNASDYEAQQYDMKAKEEVAAAQREAMMKRKEGALVNSRSQALAAASGAGAGIEAPTIVKLMTETAGAAEYNAGTSMYGGNSRAAGLRDAARSSRASGKASLLGSIFSGFGTAASRTAIASDIFNGLDPKGPMADPTKGLKPLKDPWAGLRKAKDPWAGYR